MPKVGSKKVVVDYLTYSNLKDPYLELLHELTTSFPVSVIEDYKTLVNFGENFLEPIHNWYEYKQGFAKRLIQTLIRKEHPPKELYILDPFCGVGTTNLVAKSMGYNSIGLDVNPVATFASIVKTRDYTENNIQTISDSIQNFHNKLEWKMKADPKVISTSFTKEQLKKLKKIRGYIDSVENKNSREFLLLAYLSVIEDASIRIKDGNGIKIRKNKKQILDIYGYFLLKAKSMLKDIQDSDFSFETDHKVLNSSILIDETFNLLEDQSVGMSIFSPPYANCFDYCEVYKLELWLGSFVDSYSDFKKYRSMALRSHVNSKFDHKINNQLEDVDLIAALIATFNIWNKNIPHMIRGYFDDMCALLRKQYVLMTANSKCFIVVGNSAYKGIIVPTDLIIAKIASMNGYKVNSISVARQLRSSAQQTEELKAKYGNLMRESIIELQKS